MVLVAEVLVHEHFIQREPSESNLGPLHSFCCLLLGPQHWPMLSKFFLS